MSFDLTDPVVLSIAVSVLAGGAVIALALALFGSSLLERGRAQKRLEELSHKDGAASKKPLRDTSRDRRKLVEETLKELEQKQREHRARMTLKRQLEQSGLAVTPTVFYIASMVFALTCGLIAFVFGMKPWIAALIAFVAGFGLPRWVIGFLCARRKGAFAEEFANAIDVIVRGVKAGLPLGECLQIIAREAQPPVKEEFQALVDAQKMGVPFDQSLQRMYESMPLAEVNFFAIVLGIQQKTGGNLSEALGNLSSVLRGRKSMRGKIEAMSSEAKASAMIIGSLPPGVMVIVYMTTPDYISLLWTDPMGQMMMGGGLLWMLTGILVMRKMINFNF